MSLSWYRYVPSPFPKCGIAKPGSPVALPMLPRLPTSTTADALMLGMARVDRSGRLCNRDLFETLAWRPGHRVDMALADGVLVIARAASGPHAVRSRGELGIPLALRQLCGIAPESTVLLAASVAEDVLAVYPVALVAQLLIEFHAH
jgi:hypothetical protein